MMDTVIYWIGFVFTALVAGYALFWVFDKVISYILKIFGGLDIFLRFVYRRKEFYRWLHEQGKADDEVQ